MGPIFTDEVRLMEISFENDPAIVAGATLSSAAVIEILLKAGETEAEGVLLGAATDPVRAAPVINGTSKGIRFWVKGPPATLLLVRGEALGSNNEVIKARDVLIVE